MWLSQWRRQREISRNARARSNWSGLSAFVRPALVASLFEVEVRLQGPVSLSSSFAEDGATNADVGGALGDGDLEVTAHAHREVGQRDAGVLLEAIPQFT